MMFLIICIILFIVIALFSCYASIAAEKEIWKTIFVLFLFLALIIWGCLTTESKRIQFKNCLLKDGAIEYHIDSITGKRFLVATDSTLSETTKMFIK